MRPIAHLPKLIAALVILVCLVATTPAIARHPASAVTSSAALDAATHKVPSLYESFWPLILLRTPAMPVFRPQQIFEPVRKMPAIPVYRPPQILEPVRKMPAIQVYRPPQIIEPVRKMPALEVYRPRQIVR